MRWTPEQVFETQLADTMTEFIAEQSHTPDTDDFWFEIDAYAADLVSDMLRYARAFARDNQYNGPRKEDDE